MFWVCSGLHLQKVKTDKFRPDTCIGSVHLHFGSAGVCISLLKCQNFLPSVEHEIGWIARESDFLKSHAFKVIQTLGTNDLFKSQSSIRRLKTKEICFDNETPQTERRRQYMKILFSTLKFRVCTKNKNISIRSILFRNQEREKLTALLRTNTCWAGEFTGVSASAGELWLDFPCHRNEWGWYNLSAEKLRI